MQSQETKHELLETLRKRVTEVRRPTTSTKKHVWQDLLAGGVAGSAGILVGHPLDTIKVRLQMNTTTTTSSSRSSLFRGLGAPLATAAFVNASIFTSFGMTTRLWTENGLPFANVAGGAVAGIVSSLWLCPAEHIKVRLQTQSSANMVYTGTLDAFTKILQTNGMVGLYRGMAATWARQIPAFSVYFSVYPPLQAHARQYYFRKENEDWAAAIFAGGMAGSLSWAVVYPLDVIKSQIQNKPFDTNLSERSMRYVATSLWTQQGIRGLYRGLTITVLRAFPVNGIIFCVYEYTLQFMASKVPEHHIPPDMV